MEGLTLNIIHYMNITMPLKNIKRGNVPHIEISEISENLRK